MNKPDNPVPVKSSSLLRGLSIQQRVPLLICILLLSTVLAVGIASYIGVKQSSLRLAGDRLKTVTEQLSNIYSQTALNAMLSTRSVSNEETIHHYLLYPGTIGDSVAKRTLWRLQTDTQSLYVELLNRDRQRVLRAGKPGTETGIDAATMLASLKLTNDSTGVSRMYRLNDSLYYAIVSLVISDKQTIGYLIRWRLVFTTPQTIQQFSQLLGTNAMLYMGNDDQSVWSDLINPVKAPPVNVGDSSRYYTYARTHVGPVIATARPIAHTQWMILIEFPQQAILEAAKRYAVWILLIGGSITLIGIIIAWFMSRNITRPLKRLMAATTAIASGDYNVAVESNRRDETGALARSFNQMSEQIKNATENLEHKVKERTEQLELVNKEAEQARQRSMQEKLISETSIKVQEREREEIGKELHDNINQLLAAAKLYMDYAINKDGFRSERLEQSKLNISRAIDEIRKLSKALVAPSLGDESLEEIIESLLGDIRKTTSLDVHLQTTNYDESFLSDEIKLVLYRITQEQLNNILKHAKASKVIVCLSTTDKKVCLSIQDDGAGFDTSKNSPGIGLRNIITRASHHNGTATITSSPGNGCKLDVMIPV